jgi:hypothetical protein
VTHPETPKIIAGKHPGAVEISVQVTSKGLPPETPKIIAGQHPDTI